MAHPRKQIRAAMVALLAGAGTAAGARVYPTRVDPARRNSELPEIGVYTLKESVDLEASAGQAPRLLYRGLDVMIQGWVMPTDGTTVDDAMDDLAEQIEAAMDSDIYLGVPPNDLAADSMLASTSMDVVADGDREMGLLVMTYHVTYQSQAPATPEPADDFTTADATTNLDNAQAAADETETQFTVPT